MTSSSAPCSEDQLAPLHGQRATRWAVLVLIALYVAFFGWLAIMRHETFGSSAMDMGYTDQVVWNTRHGRILRFSTLENATIDLPLDQFRRTDTLLAFHVELLLVPISLLYCVWSDPLVLVLLQVVVIAIGAWPTYVLARDRLRSPIAGLAFAAAYLAAPATQGATLSDFHATSLCISLFVFLMLAIYRRRWTAYWVLLVVCLLAKEDISLIVCMLGAWLIVRHRLWRIGSITMVLGLGWLLFCTLWILPHHNGLDGSPFLHRLAIFGPTLRDSIAAFLAEPALLPRWLLRPEILTYLRGLMASGGYLSLLSPLTLAIAAPPMAINIFSTWDWTYSGGEHYTATILPFVIVSAIHGMNSLARWLSVGHPQRRDRVVLGLSAVLVVISGSQYMRYGIWPLSPTFRTPQMTAHHRIGHAIIRRIPADASVSAQSNLYPHISQRERAYFYPAVNDAEYVLLDVSGVSYPMTVDGLYYEVQQLLRSGAYGVLTAQDGYLLLQRDLAPSLDARLPTSFYAFVHRKGQDIPNPVRVRFGEALELVGWETRYLNVVQSHSLPITVTTWWRPLYDLERNYQFALFFTREDGAIEFGYDRDTATTRWHPSSRWKADEIIRMETPILTGGALNEVLVAVAEPGRDVWQAQDRLPIASTGIVAGDLADQSTLYRAIRLP